jgi:uncharacterized membrane protein YvbJ
LGQAQKTDKILEREKEQQKERAKLEERERWQREFVARQAMVEQQMAHRKEMRKVPKVAKAFLILWGSVFVFSVLLFIMSFHPATKNLVASLLSSFKVF